MDTMSETFEQYKADEAICDRACGCVHCQAEQSASEAHIGVFVEATSFLEENSIVKLLASAIRWQHDNSGVSPLKVTYRGGENDRHFATITYVENRQERWRKNAELKQRLTAAQQARRRE